MLEMITSNIVSEGSADLPRQREKSEDSHWHTADGQTWRAHVDRMGRMTSGPALLAWKKLHGGGFCRKRVAKREENACVDHRSALRDIFGCSCSRDETIALYDSWMCICTVAGGRTLSDEVMI